MPEHGGGDAKIIQVTREEPAVTPKFVVEDSPTKATLITIFSLLFFGVSLAGAIIKLASAGDLNGLRALLMRDDVLGWLGTVWIYVGPTFWLVWRSRKTWFRTARDVEIVKAADNQVAMLKSEVAPAPDASPPTRARETTTAGAVRLLDGSVLLHRGGAWPQIDEEPAPTFSYDGGQRFTAEDYDDDARRWPAADTAPRIPGDALDGIIPSPRAGQPPMPSRPLPGPIPPAADGD